MKDNFRSKIAFGLLLLFSVAVLTAGAPAVSPGSGGKDRGSRPSVMIRLNNNPKVAAAWHNIIDGKKVDVSNTPGILVDGTGFKNGRAHITAYFAGGVAAEGSVEVRSGVFETLLPLKAPLEDPHGIKIQVGDGFTQSVPVRLIRLRGTVRLSEGARVPSPLVTTGLYRYSDFYMTVIGDKKGNFEMLLPDTADPISIFEENTSKTRLECRNYPAGTKEGPQLNICMESKLKFSADK